MRLDELREPARLAADDVVGQDHREGLVANQVRGAGHGVAEAQRLILAHVGNFPAGHCRAAHGLERVPLAGRIEARLQLGGVVEVVAQRRLAARGHEYEVLDAGLAGLLDGVVNQRPVDEGQDFLRDRLRGGQEARAQPRDGENCLADGHGYCAAHLFRIVDRSAVRASTSALLPAASTLSLSRFSVLEARRLNRQSPKSHDSPSVRSTEAASGSKMPRTAATAAPLSATRKFISPLEGNSARISATASARVWPDWWSCRAISIQGSIPLSQLKKSRK